MFGSYKVLQRYEQVMSIPVLFDVAAKQPRLRLLRCVPLAG